MSRTTSPQMEQALEAVTDKRKTKRMTPAQAAEEFGVPRNSIYKHRIYQEFVAKKREAGNV